MRITHLLIIAILLFGLTGCDLFSTRDPESPVSGRNTWETPRIPMDVLDNMRAALIERDAVNYLRSFSSTLFHFEADAVALSRDPALAGWDYADESQHINRLFSEGTLSGDSMLSVIFTTPEVTMIGDSAQIHSLYELAAGVALSGVPHRFAGTADFTLRVGGDGYWQIERWRDTRTEDEATWSDFKSLVR
ncbi:hypothetical protein EHM69_13215 [candidate division KSB1 bacterium]|nr:MAG: hypothetical protein EHM69_13215 [candidate division KSB1 bacterium]